MNAKAVEALPVLVILLVVSVATSISVYVVTQPLNQEVKVACVGDSLTESSGYTYYLWMMQGMSNCSLKNFGVGSTTISLNTETPYMKTEAFQNALDFQPNVVIIMLGTNDAQPNLKHNNATLTEDYVKLINSFQKLSSKPEIWIVLPPPIYSNQTNAIDAQYFNQTVLPSIRQAANQTGLPIIDVNSALLNHSYCFKEDGVHVNSSGAAIIASTINRALRGETGKQSYSISIFDSTPFFKA
jgi:acyl-CoA thioesterase I